jgi:hypothetical protein
MAIARPKRLTTVVVDPQLVPIPVQPGHPDAAEMIPDDGRLTDPLTLAEEMLIEGFEEDEVDGQAAIIPRRIAASR